MPFKEIDFIKIQRKTAGSFMVTIPHEAVKKLGIKDNETMKVYLDTEKKQVLFELLKG
jgi:antitoxin component of MazEF toxin-antitoxin module